MTVKEHYSDFAQLSGLLSFNLVLVCLSFSPEEAFENRLPMQTCHRVWYLQQKQNQNHHQYNNEIRIQMSPIHQLTLAKDLYWSGNGLA